MVSRTKRLTALLVAILLLAGLNECLQLRNETVAVNNKPLPVFEHFSKEMGKESILATAEQPMGNDSGLTRAFVAIGVLFILSIIFWDYRDKSYWQRRNVPGPRSLPIFGQLPVLSLDRRTQIHGLANKHIAEWSQRFGKVFGFKQGGRSVLAISDPNLVHEITVKKADCFLDRFDAKTQVSSNHPYNDLTTADSTGKVPWHSLRKAAIPALSTNRLRELTSIAVDSANAAVAELEKQIEGAKADQPLDPIEANIIPMLEQSIFQFSARLLVQNICGLEHYKGLTDEQFRRYADMFRLNVCKASSKFLETSMYSRVHGASIKACLLFPPVAKFLHPLVQKFRRAHSDTAFVLTAKAIEEEESPVTDGNTVDKTSLAHFLVDGKLASNSMLSSVHTTIGLVCHALASNQRVQASIRQELRTAKLGKVPTYEQLTQLPFLEVCIKEVMRLYPDASGLFERVCTKATSIQMPSGQQLTIEKGCVVKPDVKTIHQDPEIWGDNPDQFNPYRWANQTANPERASAQKLGWLSMGSGARQCPGQRLAMVMMKSVLVRMLRRFELSLSDESELKFVDGNYMAGETWCVYYSFNKLEKLNIKLEALTEIP